MLEEEKNRLVFHGGPTNPKIITARVCKIFHKRKKNKYIFCTGCSKSSLREGVIQILEFFLRGHPQQNVWSVSFFLSYW